MKVWEFQNLKVQQETILLTLYSALKNDVVLLKRYNDIFPNLMEVAIIEPANETVLLESYYYIPHHLDSREDKKVRIVFDVSAKSEEPSSNVFTRVLSLLFWYFYFDAI